MSAAIHEGLRLAAWARPYGPINGMPIVRLSISPYRTSRQARGFLAALRETVAELERVRLAGGRDEGLGRARGHDGAGPVDPRRSGITLPHEHLYINQWRIPERFDYPLLTDDDEILADEVGLFRAAGGQTIVDATTPERGPRAGAAAGAGRADGRDHA